MMKIISKAAAVLGIVLTLAVACLFVPPPQHARAQFADQGTWATATSVTASGATTVTLTLNNVASLSDIGRPVDMVDIFRNSSHIMPVVEEALKLPSPPKVIWMQLGARDDVAAAKVEAAGIMVVMNRCPKIEWGRLSSEISWMGVNSRTISSKRAPVPTQGMRLSLNRMSVSGGETAASDRAAKNKSDLS